MVPAIDALGATATVACGINGNGQVVGAFTDSSGHIHGFLESAGTFTRIDVPGAASTAVCGINDSGQMVGTFMDSAGHYHGFLDNAGVITTIDVPGAIGTAARAINNSGQIVGVFDTGRDQFYTEEYHGFLAIGGGFTTIDAPAAYQSINDYYEHGRSYLTIALGINNSGQVVGMFKDLDIDYGWHGFTFSDGMFTPLDDSVNETCGGLTATDEPPEIFALGINDSGLIAGILRAGSVANTFQGTTYCDRPYVYHAFLSNGGGFMTSDVPGARFTAALGINDPGAVVGGFMDSNARIHGFLYSSGTFTTIDYPSVSLVDPVTPGLLNGPKLVDTSTQQNIDALATQGRPVQGVAADGVSELLIQIPAQNVGDPFAVTVYNDQGGESSSTDDDGALGNPGDTSFTANSLTVNAVSTTNSGPMAFAVYRAPVDFVRETPPTGSITCGGITGQAGQPQDPQLPCRTVSLQINGPGGLSGATITIVRPPVILIHGIWDDFTTWNNFGPLFSNGVADSRFYVSPVGYSALVGNRLTSISPVDGLLIFLAPGIRENSLGFAYNAKGVEAQIEGQILYFKNGHNPAGIPVAAVQADIVAHSMGGDITRTLPIAPTVNFLSDTTFGQGDIHKVITIDTPHLGTPLATDLLRPVSSCVWDMLMVAGNFAFQSANLSGVPVDGAAGDLEGDGQNIGASSLALQALAQPGPHPLPTALIVGVMNSTSLASLSSAPASVILRNVCGVDAGDPLGLALTPTGWPAVFGQPSDGIVPLSSQLNNTSPTPDQEFFGFVHSDGTEQLGFTGPSVLDETQTPHKIPTEVINLLNTPVSNHSVFTRLQP